MCSIEAYAATQILQAGAQYRADKAKAKNINDTANATAANMRDTAIWDDNNLIRQKEDKRKEFSNELFKSGIEGKKTKSKVSLNIAERGIAGTAVDLLIGDVDRQVGFYKNTMDANWESYLRSNISNREAANARYSNQITSLPRSYQPSWSMYALQAGVNIGSMYMMTKAPNTGGNTGGVNNG